MRESTTLRASPGGRRAPTTDHGPAVAGRLHPAPLPDPPRQRPRRGGSGSGAGQVGCSDQAARDAIRAFHGRGLAALARRSSRPKTTAPAFDAAGAARLRELLHRSPREFGKDTGLWTLPLAAEVSAAEGPTAGPVTGETVRATLARLGVRWQRAKRWIVSPDPAYARKRASATAGAPA